VNGNSKGTALSSEQMAQGNGLRMRTGVEREQNLVVIKGPGGTESPRGHGVQGNGFAKRTDLERELELLVSRDEKGTDTLSQQQRTGKWLR